jgi:hypothetical protein
VLLDPFDDVLQYGEEHEGTIFAFQRQKGEVLAPEAIGDFDLGGGKDDARRAFVPSYKCACMYYCTYTNHYICAYVPRYMCAGFEEVFQVQLLERLA